MLGCVSFERMLTSANIFSSSSLMMFDFLMHFIALRRPINQTSKQASFQARTLGITTAIPVCFCSTKRTLPKAPKEEAASKQRFSK